MSKRDRRDGDRRGDRRDSQPEDEQQRRMGESEVQEGDSLTALKAILSKVATLLKPLQLTPDESIRLVEQLYGKVLETDLQLAAETDDTRKSSVLAAIQNATIRREGDRIVVDYTTAAVEPPAPRDEAAPPVRAATPAPVAVAPVRGDAPAPAADRGEAAPAGPLTPAPAEAATEEARPTTPAPTEDAPVSSGVQEPPAEKAPRRAAPRRPAAAKPAPAEAKPPAD